MFNQAGEQNSHEIARPQAVSFDGVAVIMLAVFAGLAPFFFIPTSSFPLQLTKVVFVALAALLTLACFIAGRMKERRISLPVHPLFFAAFAIPVAYLISASFSSNVWLSLAGGGLGTDSVAFIAILTLLFALPALVIRSKEKLLQQYLAILAGGGILALFQGLRLMIDPGTLSFGVLDSRTTTLLGSWYGISVFFGLIIILCLVTLIAVRLEGMLKWFVTGAIVVSLIFLSVVNFALTWWLVGGFALAVFVYSISIGSYSRGGGTGMSFAALLVLAFAIVFLVGGENLQNTLANSFGVAHVEVRPSWQSTVDIARATLGTDFFFGSGPGTFGKQWLLYKPQIVNQTNFWNADFASGIGYVPSTIATTGLLGLIAWILFFSAFLYAGFRALLGKGSSEDPIAYYLSLSTFLGALYLWLFAILYMPGPVLLAFAFFMTGLFLASLRMREGQLREWRLSFVDTPRLGFLAVLFLTIAFLGSVASIFSVGQVFASGVYFQKAAVTLNQTGDLTTAEALTRQAISFGPQDQHYRLIAAINIAKLNALGTKTDLPPEQLRTEFQNDLATAVAAAQAGVAYDSRDYQNWLTLAQVYQTVVPLKIEGAYDNAKKAYEQAIALNPQSPALLLRQAELELLNGNRDAAEKQVVAAIEKKNNYTDAIFLLSQIQIEEGKIDEAIQAVDAATIIDPSNPVAFFQLGLLRYSKKDFTNAAAALEKAVALSADYSNARYFLGLSYAELGHPDDAIKQFERIENLNPDNQEVKSILENLRAGKPAFGTTQTAKVETLKGVPVPDAKAAE